MKNVFSNCFRVFFLIILIFTSFTPEQAVTGDMQEMVDPVDVIAVKESSPSTIVKTESPPVDAYEVVQNADAYLMSVALGNTETPSRYGPDRNDPDEGIPAHAYSPFDDMDKREVCPPGGCDYVAGRLLIKFEPDQVLSASGSRGLMPVDNMLMAAMETFDVLSLTPIFPNAQKPAPGDRIETADGELIPIPDLTLWYTAETRSTESLGSIVKELSTTEGIAVVEPDFIRKPIGEMSEVLEMGTATSLGSSLSLPGSTTDPLYDQQWHLAATHVPEAWAYLESRGLPAGGSRDIVVAVIDTGVDYTHPDLAANIWVNPAEFNGIPGVDDDGNGYVDDIHGADTVYPDGNPMDDHGHGTHVAGIIAAQANNGIGGVGVAYNVQVMPIKAAQYSGVLSSSDIAEAIYYAVAKGADVINMSFGGYARSTVEEDALAVAFGQAVLVAAAGNDGIPNDAKCLGAPMYPAAYNWILGVMASDNSNSRVAFSNSECIPHDTKEYELMAPGVSIWSTLPGEQFAAWSGTSMSAPIISGIAALARTKWYDKNIYSSRFIMGQIASNTSQTIGGVAFAINALTIPPQPELSYLQHWLFDTPVIDPINDNDGIIDAGETVDLAIVIRNHWGKAENVTVTMEPWAEGAVYPDPYVTMIYDTVNYGAIGSFNVDDNGLIYDDAGAIIGVQHPFRFSVALDASNDHVVPIKITITAENGYDPLDPQSPYVYTDYLYVIIQKGFQLPQVISSNMTLNSDKLWIIDRPVLIERGVTVNVEPGTQIQFWSSEPYDPYSSISRSYLQVEGNLFINGNYDNPIEIFPSLQFSDFITEIRKNLDGIVEIRYVQAMNPRWGETYQMIHIIDHTQFIQSFPTLKSIYTSGGVSYEGPVVNSEILSNSILKDLGPLTIFSGQDDLFDGCVVRTSTVYQFPFTRYSLSDNVFLRNNKVSNYGSLISTNGTITYNKTFLKPLFPIQNSGKTYFVVPILYTPLEIAEKFAEYLGGHLADINDSLENDFAVQYLNDLRSSALPEMDCGYFNSSCLSLYSSKLWIGLNDTNYDEVFEWTSGANDTYTNWNLGYPQPVISESSVYRNSLVFLTGQYWVNESEGYPTWWSSYGSWLIEIPVELTLYQIESARNEFLANGNFGQFHNNAILNYYINADPNTWMKFAPINPVTDYTESRYLDWVYSDNYWGTTSRVLIDASIIDNKDDFNLPNMIYEPIQSIPSESIYPFLYDVILSTAIDIDTAVVGAEPVTFTVTFNRDMDQSIQPQVSFGPDVPMTDYTVHPINGGWTDTRTWAGTFNITPVTGDGYQLIRVAGAVAADDPWLVTGNDAGRFRFEIITSGTEAMNLQATGGEGYVDLMWTQSDFDLLAGFHLYRSTSMDGIYTRINSSIIPPETRSYRDTNVTPGQPYYYKFTVVKSDMTESGFSNTATATPLDTIPPVLVHTPITSADPGLQLSISASATDNVAVTAVTLYYRHIGDIPYLSKTMVRTTGSTYYATIEGSLLTSPGIQYYIEATDGISITRNGRAENPNSVTVDDRPVVTIVTPNKGPSSGGTSVTISGSNFKSGATVTFGGASASNVVVVSTNQVTCTTPSHFPATVDVRVTNTDAQQGVLLNGFTFQSTSAQVSLPNTGGGVGNMVTVPVNAANIHGLVAASLTINYDPTILTARSASTGSLTAGWTFASNLTTAGQVRLSMISSGGGVDGTGILSNIEFEVIGTPGSSSALSITNALLNDGAITVELTAGSFSVDNVYNVSGLISFWNGNLPVPGAQLTLTGDKVYNAVSGTDGNFTVQGAAIDAYVLKAAKSDGDNGISAYDASLALQHDVGLINLSGHAALAADVNSTGAITSMDAYYILQKAADLISLPFPGSGKAWKFDPAERSIGTLASNITGQNFTAILLGDISGNWTNPGTRAQAAEDQLPRTASATLTIPGSTVLPGATVNVPISLDITDGDLYGADITFAYDPAHITINSVSLGSLTTGWSIATNLSEVGLVKIAIARAIPITTDGELLVISMTAHGEPGTESALTFTRGELNESAIVSELVSGSIRIADNYQVFLPLILK